MLALVAEISGGALGLSWLTTASPHLQFLLLITGIVLLIYSLTSNSRSRFSPLSLMPHPSSLGTPSLRTSHLVLSTIFLLALFLRLWHNADTIRVLVDELNFVSGMTNFWKPNHPIGLLTPMDNVSPFTWLFPYWQANFVAVFGRDMAAIRAVSAVVGALNIPALYLLANALFNRRVALLAAFLLATFPPHIHYSRIALLSITDPLMGTLALAFLARGLKEGRRLDFAQGGVFLGLTQYFFEGGRLLFPALVLAWVVGMGIFRTRSIVSLQETVHYAGLGRFGLAAALVSFPVYYTWIVLGRTLVGRMDDSGLGAGYWNNLFTAPLETLPRFLSDHLLPAFNAYLFTPDQSTYYGGDTALILPLLVPIFLLGVAFIVRRFRQPGMLLLALWLVGVALGNSLLRISGASTHYVVAFPAIALVLALGAHETLQLIPATRTSKFPMILLAIGLGIIQVTYYFGPHLSNFDNDFRRSRPYPDLEDVVYRSLDYPPGTQVHVVNPSIFDPNFAANFLYFFRDDLKTDGYVTGALNADLLAALPRTVDHAFFLSAGDVQTLSLLQTYYQSALEGPFFSPYNGVPEKQLILFYVHHLD
jgi:hypothetical protein